MATARTITIPEIESLAERLLSRGLSTNAYDRDLRLASKCLRALARSFNRGDAVIIDRD